MEKESKVAVMTTSADCLALAGKLCGTSRRSDADPAILDKIRGDLIAAQVDIFIGKVLSRHQVKLSETARRQVLARAAEALDL